MSMFKKHQGLYSALLLLISFVLAATSVYESAVDRPLAIVRRFKPQVEFKKAGNGEWAEAKMAQQLFSGDTLRTGPQGYAAVQFMDNSLVKVKSNSLLVVMGEVRGKDNTATRLAVELGEVFLNVTKRNSDFEVATPSAVAAVKGTGFSTSVDEAGQSTFVVVEGIVEVVALRSGQKATLQRGKKASVDKSGQNLTTSNASTNEMNETQQSFDDDDQNATPKILRLRFVNDKGEVREFELKYYEQQ